MQWWARVIQPMIVCTEALVPTSHDKPELSDDHQLSFVTVRIVRALALACCACVALASCSKDPLPSWRDTATKRAIVDFVNETSTRDSADFVPAAERIAVFDNDGTLWSEQPLYFQLLFVIDRIRELAPQHPEWSEQEPFASVLEGDVNAALSHGMHGLLEMVAATHAGMTTGEFEQIVVDWLGSARHPTTGRAYPDMVFLPMLELLHYLRANGFRTFIVSGGGIEFMRPWVFEVYGIPPEQVVGSSIKTTYEVRDGEPVLMRLPEVSFIDDKAGKPVGINLHIGRRPIIAFGNSDGDFEMLEWTTSGPGPRLGVLVHHTDGEREWAYDRDSHVGRLARGLDEAEGRGWLVIDMKADWATIYSWPGPAR